MSDTWRAGWPCRRIPLRHQHRVVPDRGRGQRGRQGPQHLGHLHRPARPDRRRQQRCRRLRPLPPVGRGRGAAPAPRRRRLPLLDRLAAGPAHGSGPGQRGGSDVLRPPGRRSARGRHPADGDPLPWDLPQVLEDDGGWLSRDTALRFGEYAALVAERLGDRVTHWCPVNEPNVVTMSGYAQEEMAPGKGLMLGALPVATTSCSATAWQRRRSGPQAPARSGRPRTTSRSIRRVPVRATGLPRTSSTSSGTGCSPTRSCSGATPRAGPTRCRAGGRRPRPDRAASRLLRAELLLPDAGGAPAEGSDLPFELAETTGYPTTDFGWPSYPRVSPSCWSR